MNTITITTTQNIDLEYDLASLGERIAGYIIDGLILVAYLITVIAIFIRGGYIDTMEWLAFVFIIPPFFYDLASEVFMNGQSVGKKAMNIKVVSLDGGQPTLGQYMIRWLFRLIDFTLSNSLCAVICIAVNAKNQRLGDMVAGTTLVKTIARTAFQQTIFTPPPVVDYRVTFPEVAGLSDRDMQLIKEVILNVNASGNISLAQQAADKVKETLQIQTDLEPKMFLHVVLADYNYVTSQP